jgi:hypothetical protein
MKVDLNLFDGLETETKLCTMCMQVLPTHMFGKEGSKGYLRYECKPCAKKQGKLVAKIKKSAPPVKPDHKCPICKRTAEQLTSYGKKKKSVWVADHNHETEQFRGWLCHKCNLGLGNLGDDPERCKRAMEYLNEN